MPAALATLLLATALLSGPVSPAHAQTAAASNGADPGIAPGDDFFAYANGGWLKNTRIPTGMHRWTVRTEIDARTRQRVSTLLDDASAEPAGSLGRKAADFRAAWLNEAAIEARGLASVTPLLDSIDRVQDKAGLTRLLGRWLRADVDPLNWGVYRSSHLLGLSVEPGIHGEKTNVAFLVQGGLGLPDRENYLGTEAKVVSLRAQYQEYLTRQLTLAGFDHAAPRAQAVLALETAIAQTQATREASAEDRNADNRWTRADFVQRAPGIDWPAFFAAAGLATQEEFVAWQPGAVVGVAALVASEPLPTWKDYLRVRIIDRYADVLPRGFAEPALALHDAATGQSPQRSRAERALAATQLAMSEALGRMYAERYFPAEQKARVEAITNNVRAALERRIAGVTWMSPATKTLALGKLKTLYFGVGYPDHWQDYSGLRVDAEDAVGNLRRVEDRNYRQALAGLNQPVDMTQWWISPQAVGAVLVFQQNAYNFSAALLQPPKFDPSASDAANYGAIGAIVGHEITHFVDRLGAEWDAQGKAGRWWTAEDSARFQAASEPLVQQFSGYKPFPDMAVNGERTRTENVADLGGLAAAFDAYRRALGGRSGDSSYVRQQDREFFLGFARSWRGTLDDGALRSQLSTDSHAPDRYRIATVRNLDAWYDAFQVMPGQKLYLAPEARVRIW